MRYALLLAASDAAMPQPGTPEFDAEMAAFGVFGEMAGDAIVAGEALEARSTCRTVRQGPNGPLITDGPFAESVEGLGGFFVLEAADLDEVIELARHVPPAGYGSIEIRPMVEWTETASDREGPVPAPRWLATIHGPELESETPGTPEWDEGVARHTTFGQSAGDALLAAGAVSPTRTATTIRLHDGQLAVTDGPYAEGVEVIGGFYVFGGPLEQVLDLATKVPVMEDGAVQLQRIEELDG